MPSHTYPRLSLLEFVGLGLTGFRNVSLEIDTVLFGIMNLQLTQPVTLLFWNIFKLAPYGLRGIWPGRRVVGIAFCRAFTLNTRQRLYLNPTSGEAFHSFCQTNGFSCESETLNCGPKAPSATLHTAQLSGSADGNDNVMLYFHGGGYGVPLNGKIMPMFADCARSAGAGQLVALEYTVAPNLKYPGQLVQAAASLRCLLEDRGVRPDQILLSGDSAGGNLVMALLAHIQRPHPDVPEIQGLSKEGGKNLKGALLVSPWVSTKYTASSYAENGGVDMLDADLISYFTDLWGASEDPWTSPMTSTTSDFWRGLPVKKIMMTVGTWECFYDDIVQLADIMLAGGVDVTLAKGEGEVHVTSMLDTVLGLPRTGTAVSMLDWASRL